MLPTNEQLADIFATSTLMAMRERINVPRELLERVLYLMDNYIGTTHTEEDELRAILSAPSPAGVDGLEVRAYEDSGGALYTAKLLEIMAVDSAGCEPLCRLSVAHAIIDGMRGEVERLTGLWDLELARAQKAENELAHAVLAIDQQGQRVEALALCVKSLDQLLPYLGKVPADIGLINNALMAARPALAAHSAKGVV